jgi:hypothetical protein
MKDGKDYVLIDVHSGELTVWRYYATFEFLGRTRFAVDDADGEWWIDGEPSGFDCLGEL